VKKVKNHCAKHWNNTPALIAFTHHQIVIQQ